LKNIFETHQQGKDPLSKKILEAIGLELSPYMRSKKSLKKEERPKRNFLQVDLEIFEEQTKGLRASTKIIYLALQSVAVRSGEVKAVILSTAEIKNLVSKGYGKLCIRRAIKELVEAGLIQIGRVGGFMWDGWRYSKLRIILLACPLLLKTVTTLYNSSTEINENYLKIPLEEALPPPSGVFENDFYLSEELFNESLKDSMAPYTVESDQEKAEMAQHLAEIAAFWAEKRKIWGQEFEQKKKKAIEWEARKFKASIKSIFTRWPTLQALGFSDWDPIKNISNLENFLGEEKRRRPEIQNIIAFFVADVQSGRKHLYDSFLKWADERHEQDKVNRNRERERAREREGTKQNLVNLSAYFMSLGILSK
jgi:hypothetical protein